MRPVLAFLLLLAATASLRAADVEFVRVWPGWRDAESFDRIGDFFGGDKKHPGEIVLRTHPDARAGYYFLVRVSSHAALSGTRFVLNVIRPDAPDALTFTFPATAPAGATVFQLGLTGADWPGEKKAHAVAWKLALVAADGRVLAEQKSFLWEKPAN